MYSRLPAFVLGFHGCDQSFAAAVISGRKKLRPSENDYDWLGTGVYFWENNPQRALEFATALKGMKRKGKPVIRNPAVLGAVIDLGFREKNHIQICVRNLACIKGYFWPVTGLGQDAVAEMQ